MNSTKERNRELVRQWQSSKHGKRIIQLHSVMTYYDVNREDAKLIAKYIRKLKKARQLYRNGEMSLEDYQAYRTKTKLRKQEVLSKYEKE